MVRACVCFTSIVAHVHTCVVLALLVLSCLPKPFPLCPLQAACRSKVWSVLYARVASSTSVKQNPRVRVCARCCWSPLLLPFALPGCHCAALFPSALGESDAQAPTSLQYPQCLYSRGVQESVCSIILSGNVEVHAGVDGAYAPCARVLPLSTEGVLLPAGLKFEMGPWDVLSEKALSSTIGSYRPDFTAVRKTPVVRCLRITQVRPRFPVRHAAMDCTCEDGVVRFVQAAYLHALSETCSADAMAATFGAFTLPLPASVAQFRASKPDLIGSGVGAVMASGQSMGTPLGLVSRPQQPVRGPRSTKASATGSATTSPALSAHSAPATVVHIRDPPAPGAVPSTVTMLPVLPPTPPQAPAVTPTPAPSTAAGTGTGFSLPDASHVVSASSSNKFHRLDDEDEQPFV